MTNRERISRRNNSLSIDHETNHASVALLGDNSLAVVAGVFELFAGVEAERNQAEQGIAKQEEQDDDCDPAHHAHAL